MLREPITVTEGLFIYLSVYLAVVLMNNYTGSTVTGTFKCRKSETNSRELDAEIHYSVKLEEDSEPSETLVQLYKIR